MKNYENNREYFQNLERLRKSYKDWNGRPVSPYYFDDGALCPMTVIESNFWSDVRYCGFPMYYQFPIGKYYADFVDPWNGLVVEVDGKFHENQKEKDAKRDKYFRSLGFTVIRIKGRDTFDTDNEEGSICVAVDVVSAWYRSNNIPIPFSRSFVEEMPRELFIRWKNSLC